jgi:hypothetical protein
MSALGASLVVIWVAVHSGTAQFTRVHARDLSCGANPHEPGELTPLKLLIRGFEPHSIIGRAGSRTAEEYSNVMDYERVRRTHSDPLTCPNDRERPRGREFASRGSKQTSQSRKS